MSTISKERATGIANGEKCYTHDDVVELARIALASLEAEAVAWTDADELRDANNGGSGYLFSIGGDANKFADPRRQMMLYTAPPAPVSVPDFSALDKLAGEMLTHAMNCERRVAVAYTHCAHRLAEEVRDLRAAMLQGANGNSPAIPDGWVACSERMPETYVNVLLTDEHDDVCIGQMEFEGDIYFYVAGYPNRYKATHWMPLPAAPQQEAE